MKRPRPGEEGALIVVEAILVAVIVLSAILFLALTSRPLPDRQQRGVDLGQSASDTLAVLQRRTFLDPAGGSPLTLEQWVKRVADGDAAVAAEVQSFLDQTLATGARYEMRLNNGVSPLRLLPTVPQGAPQGASGAEVPFYPNWRTFAAATTTGTASPGQEVANVAGQAAAYALTTGSLQCVKAPDGSATGPGGVAWATTWRGTPGRVPATVPLGVWAGYSDAGCTAGPTYARVAPASLAATCGTAPPSACNYPLYGLQLVVWFGA